MKIRFDKATEEWFKNHPVSQTTVMKCNKCGLHYKPILGHKCKGYKRSKNDNI